MIQNNEHKHEIRQNPTPECHRHSHRRQRVLPYRIQQPGYSEGRARPREGDGGPEHVERVYEDGHGRCIGGGVL